MAELVAEKTTIKLPSSMISILGRVIRLRETVAYIVQQQGVITPEQSTAKTHSHFVAVLKQVQGVLCSPARRHTESHDEGVSLHGNNSSARQRLSAAFEALQVYEPSQSSSDGPDVTLPSPEYDIAQDEDNEAEEGCTAFAALSQDVRALREEVNKLWRVNYCENVNMLSPVAVATNTAIDLAREMEKEVAPIIERAGGVTKLFTAHYRSACLADGLNPNRRARKGDDFNVDAYSITKRSMYGAHLLLDQFRQDCLEAGPDQIPPLYNDQWGWYNPEVANPGEAEAKTISTREMYDRDRAAFSEVLSEVSALVHKLKWNNVEDELTRGVRLILMDPSAPIPFWLVFAAQIFIDNLEIMNVSLEQVYSNVTQLGRWITHRIDHLIKETDEKPRPAGWPAKKDSMLRRLRQDAHFFNTQVITKRKRKLLPSIKRPESVLMRHNAVFAGVWAHHLLTLMHTTGIEFANAWGAVFATTQLYYAVLLGLPKPFKWADLLLMQEMQEMQDPKRFWVGRRPRGVDELWKQWRLCRGALLADVIRSDRGGGRGVGFPTDPPVLASDSRRQPRRELATVAPASLMLRARLGGGGAGAAPARVDMTMEDVRKIVGEGKSRRAQGLSDHHALSPAKLIEALAFTLDDEAVEIHFDYFILHFQCWTMLNSFNEIAHPLFTTIFNTPDYIETEIQLPELVGLIFQAAADMVPGMPREQRFALITLAAKEMQIIVRDELGSMMADELEKLGFDVDAEEGIDEDVAWAAFLGR
ncbi:hypothetical protein B0T24DRAFT_701029 [Lasiosphaeria ovina]|uniref:DUF6604 domain-containing protein n=1 Tax=Lasiosphaeria ovina TaxID=92902 RepID=A0AAE0KIP2_9PEZI|nr:hypothetical protein B0T24DRAFT_701029 [Lasiosphaeria ovina]